jgi:hypothetical protein
MPTRPIILVALAVCAIAARVAPAQVELKAKFEPAEYTVRESQKVEQTLKLGDQDLNSKADILVIAQRSIGKKNDKGETPIQSKVKTMVVTLELPGGLSLSFNSDKPDQKADNPLLEPILDTFRALVNLKLSHTVDSQGKVTSVEGVTEKSQLRADNLKAEYQQAIDILPKEPVKPADTWERTVQQDLGMGQVFSFRRKFEYAGTVNQVPTDKNSKQLDKITATDLSVEYSIQPGGSLPLTVKKSDLKTPISKRTLLFDRELGRVVDAQEEVQIQGELVLVIGGMELPGKLDLKMEHQGGEEK